MALGLWGGDRHEQPYFDAAVDEIRALGATHIALVVTWSQADVHANRIARSERTISDAILRQTIARARQRGLEVLVFPILTLDRVKPGEWRGTLAPRDVDRWWSAYEHFIMHYATIAAATGAEALLIGSELGTTESWRQRWYHLISRVERGYRGQLVYSANWDHYRHVSFWPRVDAIGVTGYFELTGRDDASEDELAAAWSGPRDALLAFARDQRKPLWITEIGYVSVDGAAAKPWDYQLEGAVDVEEQRRAYAAFVRAWRGAAGLAGVFFWIWDGPGGADDRGYTPRQKPAESVVRAWMTSAAPAR